jgi:hypothetical protein
MSTARAGAPTRFTLFINPYQRKYYRSHEKPLPLVLMTFKEKITVARVPYKRASSAIVKSRLLQGTVGSVGATTVTVQDARGNLYTLAKVPDASYSSGQSVAFFRPGLRGPSIFAI